ncbi:hypothetical protein AA103196_0459 [Ameyamaea chiangmaiensis NBRC 103196]|uniref:Lipoprotein n=1 Tax=Ameyamaea chiangmaiensis TaxID=442969 RepID=A0A850PHB8_9PROT|nr:hypothetical protein [Ameyamaea chiangmaiensis]MBS4074857.1 hypothetical protein [Ameyamaea chiangmaiensis]NVN41810.1 hypothetical protein [Ameyamaea chiangmaiensis]GBQ63001.1 hypothetical protein AA103196_0459 [Ameyamaea chiangmaiensis NBRC 103196]
MRRTRHTHLRGSARVVMVSALLLALPALLSACGKKGPPHAPGPPERIIYPGNYPPP